MSRETVRRASLAVYSWVMRWSFVRFRGLSWGRGVVIKGRPIIDIQNGGQVVIGDDVTLNSRNYGYHLNMHSPVKLIADRAQAKIVVGSSTRIHGSCIHAYSSVIIGDHCLIAANCQIIDGSGHDLSFDNLSHRSEPDSRGVPIVIDDYVWLGANCIVLPGVHIGRGSVIGAGSVVTRDVPAMVVAAGNPAKVVREAGGAALSEYSGPAGSGV